MKSRNPFIIQDPFVSPGCTLDVSTTALLALFSFWDLTGEVIVRTGTPLPAMVRQRLRTFTYSDFLWSEVIPWMYSCVWIELYKKLKG